MISVAFVGGADGAAVGSPEHLLQPPALGLGKDIRDVPWVRRNSNFWSTEEHGKVKGIGRRGGGGDGGCGGGS